MFEFERSERRQFDNSLEAFGFGYINRIKKGKSFEKKREKKEKQKLREPSPEMVGPFVPENFYEERKEKENADEDRAK